MRAASVAIFTVLVIGSLAHAQGDFGASPSLWIRQSPPTARSWAMGFTGKAVVDEIPASGSPGALGIWALGNDVLFSVNNSRGPDDWSTATRYDLANSYQVFGWRWSGGPPDKPPVRFAVGLLHHEGDYRWGPYQVGTMFETVETVTDDLSVRNWIAGLAIDIGVEIGVGFQWRKEESSRSLYASEGSDHYDCPCAGEWREETGLFARMSLNSAIRHFITSESPLRIGDVSFDVGGAYGGGGETSTAGFSANGRILYRELPLVSVLAARDKNDPIVSSGWELNLFGAYAYRWGDREWWYYAPTNQEPRPRIGYHWSTHGHAFHSSGLSNWLEHLLASDMPSWLNWVMTNADVYYETAAFDRADSPDGTESPPGLQDISIREWGIRLRQIADLF